MNSYIIDVRQSINARRSPTAQEDTILREPFNVTHAPRSVLPSVDSHQSTRDRGTSLKITGVVQAVPRTYSADLEALTDRDFNQIYP